MKKQSWSLKNKIAAALLLFAFAAGVCFLATAGNILSAPVLGWIGLVVVACFVMLCFTVFSARERELAAYCSGLLNAGQYATLLGSYLVLGIALAVL